MNLSEFQYSYLPQTREISNSRNKNLPLFFRTEEDHIFKSNKPIYTFNFLNYKSSLNRGLNFMYFVMPKHLLVLQLPQPNLEEVR